MTFTVPAPRKAEKKRVKLKMGIEGPSGSGKTWSALALAKNLWPGAKVCVIDTENSSSELYADEFEFDILPLSAPFHTDKYIAYINAAAKAGFDVAIVDSISHQWDGDGGILRRKEELDARGGNSFTNWAKFTPEHTRFKDAIVQAQIHIICTLRNKQEYILETNDKGKQIPKKVGTASIQRDGFEYEFSLNFKLQMDHKAEVTKDRTGLFDGQLLNLADSSVSDRLRVWLESGAEVKINPLDQPASQEQMDELWAECQRRKLNKYDVKNVLKQCGVKDVKDITLRTRNQILDRLAGDDKPEESGVAA
jgi:hypothetical protein